MPRFNHFFGNASPWDTSTHWYLLATPGVVNSFYPNWKTDISVKVQREKANISSLQDTAAIDFGGRKNWQTVWINFRRTIFKAAMLIYIIWIHVYIDIWRILVLDANIWSIHVALTFLPSWGYLARIVEQYLKHPCCTYYISSFLRLSGSLYNIYTIFEQYLNNIWTLFEQ